MNRSTAMCTTLASFTVGALRPMARMKSPMTDLTWSTDGALRGARGHGQERGGLAQRGGLGASERCCLLTAGAWRRLPSRW
jgi:hypothetical protein